MNLLALPFVVLSAAFAQDAGPDRDLDMEIESLACAESGVSVAVRVLDDASRDVLFEDRRSVSTDCEPRLSVEAAEDLRVSLFDGCAAAGLDDRLCAAVAQDATRNALNASGHPTPVRAGIGLESEQDGMARGRVIVRLDDGGTAAFPTRFLDDGRFQSRAASTPRTRAQDSVLDCMQWGQVRLDGAIDLEGAALELTTTERNRCLVDDLVVHVQATGNKLVVNDERELER